MHCSTSTTASKRITRTGVEAPPGFADFGTPPPNATSIRLAWAFGERTVVLRERDASNGWVVASSYLPRQKCRGIVHTVNTRRTSCPRLQCNIWRALLETAFWKRAQYRTSTIGPVPPNLHARRKRPRQLPTPSVHIISTHSTRVLCALSRSRDVRRCFCRGTKRSARSTYNADHVYFYTRSIFNWRRQQKNKEKRTFPLTMLQWHNRYCLVGWLIN